MSSTDELVVPETSPPRRRARWVLAAVVVAVLVGGVTALAVTLTGGGRASSSGAPPASTARVDPVTQVVHDGDRVEAQGTVLAVDGERVRFCAPVAIAGVGSDDPDPVDDCPTSIDVTGIDLAALTDRTDHPANRRSPSWVTGTTRLEGVYTDGRLTDLRQSPAGEVPPSIEVPDQVPCTPPAGGWPVGAPDANADMTPVARYETGHPGEIVGVALVRPSPTQALTYVVTTGDPGAVDAALRPGTGPALCVAASRFTAAELSAATAAVDVEGPLWAGTEVYSAGGPGNLGRDGQPVFDVELQVVTDQVLAAVRDLAPGLVQFHPWLSPVG